MRGSLRDESVRCWNAEETRDEGGDSEEEDCRRKKAKGTLSARKWTTRGRERRDAQSQWKPGGFLSGKSAD